MSKRTIPNSKHSFTKKARLEEWNDCWDDDFDGEAIDDCFKRATQVFKEDQNMTINDVSLLSSYSVFKEPKHIFTSTQCNQPVNSNEENLTLKIKELQQKYAEKEGEVSIVRSNLECLRTTCEMDQKRKMLEWKERLSGCEKENKAIKSELEFKNLEIANLKQQVAELSKYVNSEQNFTQKAQITDNKFSVPITPEKHVATVSVGNPRIYRNVEKYYPLKLCHFSFSSKEIENQIFNFNKVTEHSLQEKGKPEEILSLDLAEKLHLYDIYQDLLSVINLSSEDLSCDKTIPCLDKVLHLSVQLLTKFYDYLKLMETKIQSQHEGEPHVWFLQSCSSKIIEASSICAETITVLGEIIFFNAHLKYQLLSEHTFHIDEFPYYQNFFLNGLVKGTQTPNYVILLTDIISIIGRTRVDRYCKQFLSGVMKLLCRIYSTENVNHIRQDIAEELLNQLLSLSIDFDLICQMNFFLNIMTQHPNFIHCLCPNQKKLQDRPNTVPCRFLKFTTLLENIVKKIQDETSFFCVCSNILSLMHNIFRSNNEWLHQQESKRCECLRKLCKLTVEIIYKNVELHEASNSIERYFLKNRIRLLNLLTFNAYELTQRYVTDFANFKEIIYKLTRVSDKMDRENLNKLEKLSTTEELPEVQKEKFNDVNL